MKIHFNNKEIDILVDTSSYRYTALQNVGTLYLYFASEEFINIPVGAYCIYKNITYYLMDPDVIIQIIFVLKKEKNLIRRIHLQAPLVLSMVTSEIQWIAIVSWKTVHILD